MHRSVAPAIDLHVADHDGGGGIEKAATDDPSLCPPPRGRSEEAANVATGRPPEKRVAAEEDPVAPVNAAHHRQLTTPKNEYPVLILVRFHIDPGRVVRESSVENNVAEGCFDWRTGRFNKAPCGE